MFVLVTFAQNEQTKKVRNITSHNMTSSDASKVVCTGDGLLFGYINHPIRANIDTSGAGPGEVEEGFA